MALHDARDRCTNPRNPDYRHYGQRGIEYRFSCSPAEAEAMLVAAIGRRPEGMSLDRINNEGHYEIGNLRWATLKEQRANRRQRGAE